MKIDNEFFDKVALLIEQARGFVGRTADLTVCISNYEIGRILSKRNRAARRELNMGAA